MWHALTRSKHWPIESCSRLRVSKYIRAALLLAASFVSGAQSPRDESCRAHHLELYFSVLPRFVMSFWDLSDDQPRGNCCEFNCDIQRPKTSAFALHPEDRTGDSYRHCWPFRTLLWAGEVCCLYALGGRGCLSLNRDWHVIGSGTVDTWEHRSRACLHGVNAPAAVAPTRPGLRAT